eukprot:gb/GFBE01020946.1/.p1 GENE.gb/GFBE01020946.1/~~gb/GFBE01020946.1/.p1  ORF type:complete len:477 (+),score=166.34 gb/GFBE01020946.1/:1-1431(+)
MAEAPASPSGGAAFVPDNQSKWVKHSESNMMEARNLIRDMLSTVRQNEIVEAANKNASMESANREKEAKKAVVFNKAAMHEKVIATSFKCMQDIEDAILQTEDSLSKLTHERYKGFAFLQVCERRQELRKDRPPSELFKDALTDALDAEKKALETVREELLGLEKKGKDIVLELRAKREELSADTGHRRLQMNQDLKTLSPDLTIPTKPKQAGSPKAKKATDNEGGEASPTNEAPPPEPAPSPTHQLSPEEQKKAEAQSKELLAATFKLLEKTASHRNQSLEKVIKAKQEAARVNQRTEECLSRRTTELAEMKKQLEKHALDVEAAISKAERSLDRTEKRVDRNNAKAVEKLNSDKNQLSQLRTIRQRLADDIRNKFAALEIDNMCRRVTAAKASEAKLKEKAMTRTNSAPSLGRKKTGGVSPSASNSFGETGMTAASTEAPSEESTRPNTTNKLPPLSPGGSKSLKAGAQAGLAQ